MMFGCFIVQFGCDTGKTLYCFKNTGLDHQSATSHFWETHLSPQEVIKNQFTCCCANGTDNSQAGEVGTTTAV